MRDKLRELIKTHCATIKQNVNQIETSLARLHGQQTRQSEVIEESRWLTHQLKGSSGSIGFRDVSNAAALLDYFLKSVSRPDRGLTGSELQQISDLFIKLNQAASEVSPERSKLYHLSIDEPDQH